MIVAIHQPNFFPWLGYFRKIARADIFVFLDAVQMPRKGAGSWVNRVGFVISGRCKWITAPLEHRGLQRINEVRIDDRTPWREKFIRSMVFNYGKCSFFQSIMPWLETMIHAKKDRLAEYNMMNIKEMVRRLGMRCQFVQQSSLSTRLVLEKRGSERLASICKEVGGDTYLAGDGAWGYEDVQAYEKEGIKLLQNNFQVRAYPQFGVKSFIPGLSVVDALMNVGIKETRRLLEFDSVDEEGGQID